MHICLSIDLGVSVDYEGINAWLDDKRALRVRPERRDPDVIFER